MTDWSEEKPTLELVKATVTVPEVADLLGLEPVNDKIASPWNTEERTPSCHLYEDHYHDFSTGNHGDIVDLVQAYYPGYTIAHVVTLLWNKALRSGREPGDVEKVEPRNLVDFTEELASRTAFRPSSLDDGTPFPGNVVCDESDNVLVPHADHDGVYGVKVRGADGAKSAWPGSQFTKRLYHPGCWAFMPDRYFTGRCIITEGESDCWALDAIFDDQLGHADVFALPSGAQSWKDSWLKDLEPYSHVILCMDNDRPGKAARDKLTSKVGYLRAEQLWVPDLYKDARAAIVAGWRPTLPV